MSILRWLGKKLGLTDGAFWTSYYGGDTWAGKGVSVDAALNLSTFWSCVKLNSEIIASLPLQVFERQTDGGREARSDHPLYPILHDSPNADQTALDFWTAMVARLCVVGNAMSEKTISRGRLISLQPPVDMVPFRAKDGSLKYYWNDRGKRVELPEDKVFHIKGFGLGGDAGLSPIEYARQSISLSLATEESSARTFKSGMRASGVFTLPEKMDAAQRKQFRENYIEPVEGVENEGKSLILPPGFGWQQVMLRPRDAEMLLSRRHNIEDICRWFMTPPILIGHASEGTTAWGSGIEQINIFWLTYGLGPALKRIEQQIKRSLLPAEQRKSIYAEFNIDGLLRADSAARSTYFSTALQNGYMSRNEVRRLLNLPAVEGGDVLTVQVNLQRLEQIGQMNDDAGGEVEDGPLSNVLSIVPRSRQG